MRPRHADMLRDFGYTGTLEDFRRALLAVKAESFPGIADDEIVIGKDSSAQFCVQIRRRLEAPRLGRAFILRALLSLRKNAKARKALA